MTDQIKGAASGVKDTLSSGAEKVGATSEDTRNWEAMSEDQKKQAFESIPDEKKENLSYT